MERRSLRTKEEIMKEDGLELQKRLQDDPETVVLLQPTPPRHMARARCCADYCLLAKLCGQEEVVIKDRYRVVVGEGDQRDYFHVSCIEGMINLPSLAPTRFKLDTSCHRWNDGWPWAWSLMLREWFEHGGCINPDKISEYLAAMKVYSKASARDDTRWIDWQLDHKCDHEERDGKCECSPPAREALVKPVLENQVVEGTEKCPLSQVLRRR